MDNLKGNAERAVKMLNNPRTPRRRKTKRRWQPECPWRSKIKNQNSERKNGESSTDGTGSGGVSHKLRCGMEMADAVMFTLACLSGQPAVISRGSVRQPNDHLIFLEGPSRDIRRWLSFSPNERNLTNGMDSCSCDALPTLYLRPSLACRVLKTLR